MADSTFAPERRFDPGTMQHFLNGDVTVLHCHHFAALYCQLADDAKMLNGGKHMRDAAEESFYPSLVRYFDEHGVDDPQGRARIAEEYYSFVGMGQVSLDVRPEGGSAEMTASHVDSGWIKKWGQFDRPINYIGQGFVAAAAAAVNGLPVHSFDIDETRAIVTGAPTSQFTITKAQG